MDRPSKCKNCQWYGKPYWSVINPCDNCEREDYYKAMESYYTEQYEELIDQLTNNWNELEEWLKDYIALFDNPDTLEEQTLEDLQEVLDKMKEIKEGNNVQNND